MKMMTFWKKNNLSEAAAYILFGVLTTLVNILVYALCLEVLGVHYLISNALAWMASVLFAFVTNKCFVFQSKSWAVSVVVAEMAGFVAARVATGVMDMVLMWLLTDIAEIKELWTKVFVNVLVVAANYVASKLWIFRKST